MWNNLKFWFINNSINFAIVGCGNIAERHAKQIIENGGVIIACCDVDEKKKTRICFEAKYKSLFWN